MRKLLMAGALALGCWTGAAQAVTTVSFSAGGATLPTGATVIQNFDAFAPGASIGTNSYAFNSDNSLAVRPAFGSTGNFGAVYPSGSYTINFSPTSLFSFVIGSLDATNTLTLRYSDNSTVLYTGGQIVNDPTFDAGNRTSAETNGVVTYQVTSGPQLVGATFGASINSFEFDNLAIGVPEPAAWAMMIFGFGLVGGAMRRRPTARLKLA